MFVVEIKILFIHIKLNKVTLILFRLFLHSNKDFLNILRKTLLQFF